MTARDEVVNLLNAAFAGPPVIDALVAPYYKDLDPAKNTVMVRIDEVRPSTVTNGWRQYGFALILVTPLTSAGTADDELDNFLEDVLLAVESSLIPNGVVWSLATRATYKDSFPAYQVDVSIHTKEE